MCPRAARNRAGPGAGIRRAQPAAGTEDGAGARAGVRPGDRAHEPGCIATCQTAPQVAGAAATDSR